MVASISRRELVVAGAMLYACEGTKARRVKDKNRYIYAVEFTNSRPEVIGLFMRFLNEVIVVDKSRLRGQLFVYPDHDKKQLVSYWSKVSGIPTTHFQKVIELKQKNSRYKPNSLGTFKVRYNHKVDFLRLQDMIQNVWKKAGVQ